MADTPRRREGAIPESSLDALRERAAVATPLRRGRQKPSTAAAAMTLLERAEAGAAGSADETVLRAAWGVTRAAWSLDAVPVWLDGVGRLLDGGSADWRWAAQVSSVVAALCREQVRPGGEQLRAHAAGGGVDVAAVVQGLAVYVDATLDELAVLVVGGTALGASSAAVTQVRGELERLVAWPVLAELLEPGRGVSDRSDEAGRAGSR